MKTYKVEEIFEDDPDNPDTVLMKIPEEICLQLDLKEGDKVEVIAEDGHITLKKKL